MDLDVTVDASSAERALKGARSKLGAKLREGIGEAVERDAMPHVRRLAPSVGRAYIVAKATTRYGYITTKGPKVKDRIIGLLNFGSHGITTPILPKKGKAVWTPWGPRAVVHRDPARGGKPAVYIGKHFIERGLDAAVAAMEDTVTENAMEAFSDFERSTVGS